MNVVIANISKLPEPRNKDAPGNFGEPNRYLVKVPNCDKSEITAVQTNESVIKTLAEIREIKESGGIGKIIMLVSNVVQKTVSDFFHKTALEYYKEKAKEACGITEEAFLAIAIESEDGIPKSNAWILNEICKNIQSEDIIYIDSAGGARTISNLIQLLTKILLYTGIKNPLVLYSSLQNKPYTIEDTSDFTKMTNLADAFYEFMTTGKADQLGNCFAGEKEGQGELEIYNLIDSMMEFSDKIRLGDVENLGETVIKLQKQLECIELSDSHSIETVIFNQFIPEIKESLVGNEKNTIDYLRIVKWCLKNSLIQQALTIFVEKIPISLFQKGVIRYHGDIEKVRQQHKTTKNTLDAADWETYIFYTSFLEVEKPEILKRLLNALNGGVVTADVAKAYKLINKIKGSWPNGPEDAPKSLKMFIKKRHYTSYSRFLNDIKGGANDKILCLLLGIPDYKEDGSSSTEKKFRAVENIERGNFHKKDFDISVEPKKLAEVYYGYLYVKNIRNQANHASSNEILNDSQKAVLKKYGYNFDEYTLKVVKENLYRAIRSVESCFPENETAPAPADSALAVPAPEKTACQPGDPVLL